MLKKTPFGTLALAAALAAALAGTATPLLAQRTAPPDEDGGRDVPGKPRYKLPDAFLGRPLLPEDRALAAIDGQRLVGYVEEIAAIARRSRDDGNQFWGRISGTKYDVMTQQWVADKYKALGLQVRTQDLPMAPTWVPASWSVRASGGGRTLDIKTAFPTISSPGTAAGGVDLEPVWVGLGTESDFNARDVRGKLAVVFAVPTPGIRSNSATTYGAAGRAQEKGAAAVLFVLGIPGNVKTVWYPTNLKIPSFSVGNDDGLALRQMIEGGGARVHIDLQTRTDTGLKTANVIGVLPGRDGATEDIVVIAHRDSLFEGSVDNASGMAASIGLAEYFAKIPRAERRRNLIFISTPGHHSGGPYGPAWLHENRVTALANTALIINAEHVAAVETMDFSGHLRRTDTFRPLRWYLNGSDRLAQIMFQSLDRFGVATLEEPDRQASGELRAVQKDAPSLYVMDSGPFTHSDFETPDTVPPPTIAAVTRAYARMINEVNKLDRQALVEPVAP